MINNKNKILAVISCLSFFIILLFIITGIVRAQPNSDNNKPTTIKIPPPIDVTNPPKTTEPQKLKTANIAIKSSNGKIHKYSVELAVTHEQQRIGMMYRRYIKENTGMLFIFSEESEHNFWMKDTYIPLDLIFIRKDGIITHIHRMAEENSLKRISSNGKVIAVLEVAGGETEILGINIGDRILYKDF